MNGAGQISAAQLRALQSLWSAYTRHSLDVSEGGDPRAARLAWASENLGRKVGSFSELNSAEAIRLIDALKQAVGQPSKTWSRPRSREAARAAGTHGRKGFAVEVPMIAAAEDIGRVHALRERLGISIESFEEWLRGHRSPLSRFGDATLRTVADCNKVLWALKALLRRAG